MRSKGTLAIIAGIQNLIPSRAIQRLQNWICSPSCVFKHSLQLFTGVFVMVT